MELVFCLANTCINPCRLRKQDVRPLQVKAKMFSFITVLKGYHLSVFLIACHLYNKPSICTKMQFLFKKDQLSVSYFNI